MARGAKGSLSTDQRRLQGAKGHDKWESEWFNAEKSGDPQVKRVQDQYDSIESEKAKERNFIGPRTTAGAKQSARKMKSLSSKEGKLPAWDY